MIFIVSENVENSDFNAEIERESKSTITAPTISLKCRLNKSLSCSSQFPNTAAL